MRDSRNILISMLEKLLSQMSVEEKKRVLTEKYGMVMTTELEGRIQTMCNWSEAIKEMIYEEAMEKGMEKGMKKGMEKGIEKGIEKGMEKERVNAIERMIRAGATKEQIVSFGYTEEEFAEVENALCVNV